MNLKHTRRTLKEDINPKLALAVKRPVSAHTLLLFDLFLKSI
jgi:hypothetical protein